MKIKKLSFYLLTVLLGGCVPVMSLHPLFTEETIVFEEDLLGVWVDDSNSPETIWEFERVADKADSDFEFKNPNEPQKAYKLIFSGDKGAKGSFFAHLVKLENKLFLDVYPSQFPFVPKDPNEGWFYNMFFLVPVHTFTRIDSIEPKLKMRLTDDDEMEKLLKEDPNAVKHTPTEDKLVLTASTKELQAFVLKYANDDRVFSNEIILTRKKAKNIIDPNAADPNESAKKTEK